MSYTAQDWAMATPLKWPDKPVLYALAYRMNDKTKQCNPSLAMIASDLGKDRSSVAQIRRSIKKLRDLGYLSVHTTFATRGQQTSNAYTLNVGYVHERIGGTDSPRGADSPPPSDVSPGHPGRALRPRGTDSQGVGTDSPTNKEVNKSSSTKKSSSYARDDFDLEAEMHDQEAEFNDQVEDGQADPAEFDWLGAMEWSA